MTDKTETKPCDGCDALAAELFNIKAAVAEYAYRSELGDGETMVTWYKLLDLAGVKINSSNNDQTP